MNPISPKVTNGATWATIATLVVALLNAITPDMLAGLGKWEPVAAGVIAILAFGLGAWLKEDPLRTAGAKSAPAQDVADLLKKLEALIPDKTQPVVVAPAVPAPAPVEVPPVA